MASDGFAAFGTGITFDTAEVKELTNIAWDIGTVDDIDITNHDSPDSTEEFVPGIIRVGEITLEGNFVPTDPGQVKLITNLQARTSDDVVITCADAGLATFTGVAYVKSFRPSAPVDGKTSFTATLKASGKITFAA